VTRARLRLCSNRGPVSFDVEDGEVRARPAGPGGLVPLVQPAMESAGGEWLFAASSDADRRVARDSPNGIRHGRILLRVVDLPADVERDHYVTVSNGVLKPLFHYLLDLATEPLWDRRLTAAWDSYRRVSAAFAEALARDAADGPVLIQDYHLMLVAAEFRRRRQGQRPVNGTPLHYFHHVPWCDPSYFGMLPARIRTEILEALLANDTVGFHSRRWGGAFLDCCEEHLPGCARQGDVVEQDGRRTRVLTVPGVVDAASIEAAAGSPAVGRWTADLSARALGRRTLLRVDRLDLWKNVLRGFVAFEDLLERRRELASSVWFLAILTTTRTRSRATDEYERECLRVVERVNERARSGTPDGADAITALVNRKPGQDDRARALGGMRIADAALVNPTLDGMNLVAQEICIAADGDPAVILSRGAGSFDELGDAALAIDPFDVVGTSAAIETALEMPAAERARRAGQLRSRIRAHSPTEWVERQLGGLP
jgi:trehalose 6-phosphate synthase